ncbi:MAG: putative 2OG-Fe(II) oxygenase [Isosphaerales bacterium]
MTNPSNRTQLLRRYEAEANICATDGEDPGMDFYSPFGPMIAKVTVPATLLNHINKYADEVVAGHQGMEFVLPQSVVFDGGEESLARQTARLIGRYLERVTSAQIEEVKFQSFWVVSQFAGTPSPVHFHSGDISGALYLKVPEISDEEAEDAKTYISGRQAGYINFLMGGRQQYSKSIISFKPRIGDFYIFPGWLLHGAEPFRGKGERRSMAFNAFVPYSDH